MSVGLLPPRLDLLSSEEARDVQHAGAADYVVLTEALDNGVARTPVMGYNTWYDFGGGTNLNEGAVLATAAALKRQGLKDAGFEFVVLAGGRACTTSHFALLVDCYSERAQRLLH